MNQQLTRSPLEDEHRALGAKLGGFGGWLMPIEYQGVLKEHRAVREAVGIFDLTHLGKIDVRGEGALRLLQRALSNDLSRVEHGGAQYNLALTPDGGIVDDLIAYRRGEDDWLVVPNAANTGDVLRILQAHPGPEVRHRTDLVTLAVQGPSALDLVRRFFPAVDELTYMRCAELPYRDDAFLVARSGYTGEPGVEIFASYGVATDLWRDLLDGGRPLGLEPCGLGARDTLRLEMGYPLHGNDISEDRSPVEAGLTWAVAVDKGEFAGREAVLRRREAGASARLRGLRMLGKGIPRPHYPVILDGEEIGETTSGTFSPTLRVGIAMAYLDPQVEPGQQVEVDVRGRRSPAEVVKPPFVDSSPK